MSSTLGFTTAWNTQSGADGLAAAFLNVLTFYRQHSGVRQALAEVATYDARVRDLWNRELSRFTEWTVESLRAERVAGRISTELDVAIAARVIVVGGERAISDQVALGMPAPTPPSPNNSQASGGTASIVVGEMRHTFTPSGRPRDLHVRDGGQEIGYT